MLSPLKETDCGSPDLKSEGLVVLFGGRDGKREATAVRSPGSCVHNSSVYLQNTTLHAEEAAGHFPFICLCSWILQVNVSLSHQAAADQMRFPCHIGKGSNDVFCGLCRYYVVQQNFPCVVTKSCGNDNKLSFSLLLQMTQRLIPTVNVMGTSRESFQQQGIL